MLGALLTFLVLFTLIKIFERKRDDLDNFSVATVAVVPVLSIIAVRVTLGMLYPNPLLMLLLPVVILIGMTYFLLWKPLDIPGGGSAMYTIAVLLVNEGVGFLLMASQS